MRFVTATFYIEFYFNFSCAEAKYEWSFNEEHRELNRDEARVA